MIRVMVGVLLVLALAGAAHADSQEIGSYTDVLGNTLTIYVSSTNKTTMFDLSARDKFGIKRAYWTLTLAQWNRWISLYTDAVQAWSNVREGQLREFGPDTWLGWSVKNHSQIGTRAMAWFPRTSGNSDMIVSFDQDGCRQLNALIEKANRFYRYGR